MFFLVFVLLFIVKRPVKNQEGEAGALQPPRFLLKLTIYQLKMIVKRKSSKKNI